MIHNLNNFVNESLGSLYCPPEFRQKKSAEQMENSSPTFPAEPSTRARLSR